MTSVRVENLRYSGPLESLVPGISRARGPVVVPVGELREGGGDSGLPVVSRQSGLPSLQHNSWEQ